MLNKSETTLNTPATGSAGALNPEEALTSLIESIIGPLGYELVAIEVLNHREKKLRVFIDLLEKSPDRAAVDIEDCVKVSHALDQPLDTNPVVDAVLNGAYELEVSSPGVDRPLRKTSDFDRFAGEIARVNTFRPLTGEEMRAPEYSAKNPKQKKFYGILRGFSAEAQAIQLGVIPEDGTQRKQKGKKSAKSDDKTKNETLIYIPLDLVAKAHLEPVWEHLESRPDGRKETKK